MSQTPAFDFSKFVPGFDFLQKFSGSPPTGSTPSVSSWVAPTLDPKELERRIQDLKTVQFWLEQNTQAVVATIQAMEVQRMTLAALQGMNVSMNDLAESLKVKPAADSSPSATPPSPAADAEPVQAKVKRKPAAQTTTDGASTPASSGADPMAWWGALTQQFQSIAADAMKDMQLKAEQAQAKGASPVAPSAAVKPTARKSSTRKTTQAKTQRR
jgi:hypothetical protein